MAKCDLCGATCKGSEMAQLIAVYQTEGVVDLCPQCAQWANKQKGRLLDEIAPQMRLAIAQRKRASEPRAPRWWLPSTWRG